MNSHSYRPCGQIPPHKADARPKHLLPVSAGIIATFSMQTRKKGRRQDCRRPLEKLLIYATI